MGVVDILIESEHVHAEMRVVDGECNSDRMMKRSLCLKVLWEFQQELSIWYMRRVRREP